MGSLTLHLAQELAGVFVVAAAAAVEAVADIVESSGIFLEDPLDLLAVQPRVSDRY